MFDRIRALLHRLHDHAEIEALSERDLTDLGLNRDQLHAFLRMPADIADRVSAMGAIFGISEMQLKSDHAQWVELLSVCGHCADRSACARVLARGQAADPADCGFCGNKQTLESLAQDRSARAA